MDLAKDSEISYLKYKLKLDVSDFYLTNTLTGENLEKPINDLKRRYNM